MKTIGRDKIRKKPLSPHCYGAEIVRDGQDEREVYCRGVGVSECVGCAAWHPIEDFENGDLWWHTK